MLDEKQRTAIRTARTAAGLSIRAASEAAGVDKMTWQRVEGGTRTVGDEVAIVGRMAKAVGLELRLQLVKPRK